MEYLQQYKNEILAAIEYVDEFPKYLVKKQKKSKSYMKINLSPHIYGQFNGWFLK